MSDKRKNQPITEEDIALLKEQEWDADIEDLCREARKAEDAGEWEKAQLFWERAMMSLPPDIGDNYVFLSDEENKEIWEDEYTDMGYTAVIIPHLADVLKKKFSLHTRNFDEQHNGTAVKPVGFQKKMIDKLEQTDEIIKKAEIKSKGMFIFEFLLFALCAAIALFLPYPVPEKLDKILTVEGTIILILLIIIIVAFFGMAFGLWGGIISFAITYFLITRVLADVPMWINEGFHLNNAELADTYLVRMEHAVVAFIILMNILHSMIKNCKNRKMIAKVQELYTPFAEQLYTYLNNCTKISLIWRQLSLGGTTEVFAIRLKQMYIDFDNYFDFFGFQQIKGDLQKDGWGDAIDLAPVYDNMHDYYSDLCKTVTKYLKNSEKYKDVYQKYNVK